MILYHKILRSNYVMADNLASNAERAVLPKSQNVATKHKTKLCLVQGISWKSLSTWLISLIHCKEPNSFRKAPPLGDSGSFLDGISNFFLTT